MISKVDIVLDMWDDFFQRFVNATTAEEHVARLLERGERPPDYLAKKAQNASNDARDAFIRIVLAITH